MPSLCHIQVNQPKWLTGIYCNLINAIKHFLQLSWVFFFFLYFILRKLQLKDMLICKFDWVLVLKFLTLLSAPSTKLKNLIEGMLFVRIDLKMGGFNIQIFFPKHIFQCFCPKCSFDQEVPFSVLNFFDETCVYVKTCNANKTRKLIFWRILAFLNFTYCSPRLKTNLFTHTRSCFYIETCALS